MSERKQILKEFHNQLLKYACTITPHYGFFEKVYLFLVHPLILKKNGYQAASYSKKNTFMIIT
jgi:hypothetical protein